MKESPQYKRFKHINITSDTLSLSDTRSLIIRKRAILTLSYDDMIARPDEYMLHGQVNTKSKTYLIIEMIPILDFYSYATKYHNLASMFVSGYRCSNVYINVEKGALINKDIQ